ncbi:ESF1 homolog [Thrips palmi]|uniref:ESF1 homolog n=1 Tax=Thrips palmi TaxID=161013 RepID=A0A6P8YQN4_THRPL|nr:ESF1 homolog [Thrips palmi]
MGDMAKDGRFSHIASDPRFKTIPRSQRQVKIDKRFQGMFKDERFKMNYTVDKRGKPISRTSNEDLERYYALSSSESEEEEDNDKDSDDKDHPSILPQLKKLASTSKKSEELETGSSDVESASGSEAESEPDASEDDRKLEDATENLSDKIKSKLHDMSVDYARGEGAILSDSSSDEESSDEDQDATVEHGWGELDRDAERADDITHRLAVCNMDWDRIRAVDLMVLLNSFTPPGGLIRSVTIYPSDFGLKRMKLDEEEGPTELIENSSRKKNKDGFNLSQDDEPKDDGASDDDDDDGSSEETRPEDENEEGSSYHMEKLRQYQLNRLKYFYAIVECDSPNTANHIYTECDGMEYESSATRLDLRFVPDDTTFEHAAKESCSGMPDAGKYRPRYFTTTALHQAKVDLTWDETDPSRTEITERVMSGDNVDDIDLRTYLASSSGEEEEVSEKVNSKKKKKKNEKLNSNGTKLVGEKSDNDQTDSENEDNDDPIAKYRALLSGIEEEENEKNNKGVHMEISWGLGLKQKTDEAIKKKMLKSEERTPFQEMMDKRKQKRLEKKKLKEQKKAQISEQSANENEDGTYSDDDIPSDIDMNDPYFAEEFKDQKKQSKKKKGKLREDAGETEEDLKNKAELELLLLDKEDRKHFNFKKIQEEESGNLSKRKMKARRKKGKDLEKESQDDFKVNVDDDRFSALYSSHHYNIDPTHPNFRKGQGMEALISAKQKRLVESSQESFSDSNQKPPPPKKAKRDAELSRLVKSVKNKAQNLAK